MKDSIRTEKEKIKTRVREYYLKNEEKAWGSNIFNKYNLTPTEYNEMLENQGGVCAACGGINKNGSRLGVDHDHRTNLVRGILCSKCNCALGNMDDDAKRLRLLAEYVERYNG